jgi:hypothetical protein
LAASTTLTPQERSLRSRLGGLATAAKHNPREYTQPARDALEKRFADEVDPSRILPEAERARRAEAAKRLFYTRLAYKSARARSKS